MVIGEACSMTRAAASVMEKAISKTKNVLMGSFKLVDGFLRF